MITFDDITGENINKQNPNWSQIPDHPHRILIIGDSESAKINALFNLINNEPDIDKIYIYTQNVH